MWNNCLSEYLLKEGYKNEHICPCVFIKKANSRFQIIVIYIDDLNIVGNLEEISQVTNCLKKEFEIKDIEKTKFCLNS